MKIEDDRHFFSPQQPTRQTNDAKFQELLKTFSDQLEEESRFDNTISSTVNTAFRDQI